MLQLPLMPAAVHIICGPAGPGKTRHLLRRYHEVTASEPGSALWLAPTLRSVLALRPRLRGSGSGCQNPHLFTFQDFVEEIIRVNDPDARPLSNVQRRLLAEDIIADLHARGKLSH